MMEQYPLGTNQAAALMGCSPQWVRRLIQDGRLEGRNIAGPHAERAQWRTNRDAILRFQAGESVKKEENAMNDPMADASLLDRLVEDWSDCRISVSNCPVWPDGKPMRRTWCAVLYAGSRSEYRDNAELHRTAYHRTEDELMWERADSPEDAFNRLAEVHRQAVERKRELAERQRQESERAKSNGKAEPAHHRADSKLLLPEDAAEILQCSPQTVRQLISSGRLRGVNVGMGRKRYWRTTRQDVEAFARGDAE